MADDTSYQHYIILPYASTDFRTDWINRVGITKFRVYPDSEQQVTGYFFADEKDLLLFILRWKKR